MHGLSVGDLLALFTHFLMLSLLAVGGAITTAPDMHRYVVGERHWLSDDLFTASVALAQAAPGPNVLFVAVLGFNAAGLAGAAATLLGIMLPSTTLALWATRWSHSRRDTLGVRAFKTGLAPLTLGLLLATGWILADPVRDRPAAIVLIGVTVLVMLMTRLSPLWLVALGAVVGALGWV
ncbi:chromate transporter [Rhizobacter sp. OV335]|uniref:chromate transporter n=1 Tax=Rhizobacter sp. OV335 TaxID=1500264 RepID=UPI0009128D83|nr:chromate transporter [Rhizobacter sp. OV335]SHN16731.1 chromate transporter [Rhizobacter sp. OV335]